MILEITMTIKNLLNDLRNNEKIKSVFCVDIANNALIERLVECAEYYENIEYIPLIRKINWLFSNKEHIWCDYAAVGEFDGKLFYVNNYGEVLEYLFSIYDYPFLNSKNSTMFPYYWKNINIIDNHLYYFDYCEKNGYEISLFFQAWKNGLINLKKTYLKEEPWGDPEDKFWCDVLSDNKLRLVFDYQEDAEWLKSDFIPYLIGSQEWKGLREIESSLVWLYGTGNTLYRAIAILNKFVWFMDIEGDVNCTNCDIYNLPFLLAFNPFTDDDWFLNDLSRVDNFLYYFSYCEKNRILLLPDNYAWKAKLQEIKRSVEE